MYKQWLHLMCKWATVGLDGPEFKQWQKLINQLDKVCKECEEGYICESCKNTGLELNDLEKMILGNVEKCLALHNVHSVQ